jgi:hypothetical protein
MWMQLVVWFINMSWCQHVPTQLHMQEKNLWQICSRSDPVTSQYVYPCISSNTNVILMFLILDLDAAIDTLCIAS